MNAPAWLLLALFVLCIAGIFVIDRRYRKRDEDERAHRSEKPKDADWFI